MSPPFDTPEERIRAAGGRTERPGGPTQRPQASEAIEVPLELRIVNPVQLATLPVPVRGWIVEDWLPIGCVTSLYGDGGVGKTLVAHQLMTSTALGRPWCGFDVLKCRSIALFCEDDEAELHRRQAAMCTVYGASMTDLEAMRWVSGVGEDNTLMTFDRSGLGYTTPLYDAVKKAALSHGANFVVLDTAADLFAGNENDRHQVRRFIGQLNRLAIEIDGAVLLNAHPSRSGLKSGDFDGGSTAWSNSVRSRWSLARPTADGDAEADTNVRILTRRKAHYAPIGNEIQLLWSNGVLMRPGANGGFGAAGRAAVDTVFINLLQHRREQGVYVSHNSRAANYAPKVFGKCAERQGYGIKDFEAAMGRLFDADTIIAEPYGRAGDARQRIALKTCPRAASNAT
jgi:RecA-family ATPase